MSDVVVDVRGLSKRYGAVEAVRDVSFQIERGRVVGFIGANGAGKTTTMRMIATLETPTSGTVRVVGEDNLWNPAHARARLGFMPDHFGTYPLVTALEYVDFFARAHGLEGQRRERRVAEIMRFTDLEPLADRDTNELSTGMKQRLSLARTLIHDPELLILDEPAAGLDPAARVGFKKLVRELAAAGCTLFISSHILSELGEMCDELIFIDQGRIVHKGPAESIEAIAQPVVRVELLGGIAELESWVALQPQLEVVEVQKQGVLLRLGDATDEAVATVLRRIVEQGFAVVGFQRERPSLERAFIEMVERLRAE